MSYYSRNYSDDDISTNLSIIGICIVLILLIVGCHNTSTQDVWNNGICPDCEVRYELRGVSKYLSYYACPECGQEVSRY